MIEQMANARGRGAWQLPERPGRSWVVQLEWMAQAGTAGGWDVSCYRQTCWIQIWIFTHRQMPLRQRCPSQDRLLLG